MKSSLVNRLRATIIRIVRLLVDKEFERLAEITNCKRLNAQYLESAISEYGMTLTMPPPEAFDEIDVIEVDDSVPLQLSVRFRLFTVEEGQSDLELQATLIDAVEADSMMRVEIDNILVP